MEQKVFSVRGMTCTVCSNTIHKRLSGLPGITSVAVCLLSEKLIVKGSLLCSDMIKSEVSTIGFEIEEIQEYDVSQGLICFVLDCAVEGLKLQLASRNGITEVEVEENEIEIHFVPEVISAKEIAYLIEGISGYKARVKDSKNLFSSEKLNNWLQAFFFSLFFSIPIVFLGMILPEIVDYSKLVRPMVFGTLPLYPFLMWVFATPIQFWLASRFYKSAFQALLNRTANMDLLVSLSTTSAYIYGSLMNIMYMLGFEHNSELHYINCSNTFMTSGVLISIILYGKYLESLAKSKTTYALTQLAKLQTPFANLVDNKEEREIDFRLLEINDLFKVYPGGSIPTDGTIKEGEASIDESMMTGESELVKKTQGDFVFGGTILHKGNIIVQVNKLSKDTALAHIIDLVESAQSSKPPIQSIADKISHAFVPAIVFLAFVTWLIWFLIVYNAPDVLNYSIDHDSESEFLFAFKFGVSVLIVACPCALGLAIPTAVMVATGVAAKYGILIKDASAIEAATKINKIVFDKTGTLTRGLPEISEVIMISDKYSEEDIWPWAVSLERQSEHPIAKAICEGRSSSLPVTEFKNIEGEGVSGIVSGKQVLVGNEKLVKLPFKEKNTIGMSIDEELICLFVIHEQHIIKPEAKFVVEYLLKEGYEVWMITGDTSDNAGVIAKTIGIPEDNVISNCYPADKKKIVEDLQFSLNENETFESEVLIAESGVMFIGDGINDAPSLAQANIGVSIGGIDIAMEASDIVLMRTDLTDILVALELSKKTLRRIKYNFFWTFVYNVIGIPLAAGVIYNWTGIYLNSLFAASSMAFSSVAVVLSSLQLGRFKPKFK